MSAEPLEVLTAVAAPLLCDDINTDAIIPSREIRSVSRSGLEGGLFADWRYRTVGGREPDPAFVLNDPRYAPARILLTGANFGCGSSREHAAWALAGYGFRAVIAESFNPIFRGNAVVNGLAPVVVAKAAIAALAAAVESDPARNLVTIDLARLEVVGPDGSVWPFRMDAEPREMLREGLDGIDLTMKKMPQIMAFRRADREARPWAYP